MKQLYIVIFLCISLLFSVESASAQVSESGNSVKELPIEGLSIYPNPASGQKVYIVTSSNKPKVVEIYNVLGKNILSANLTSSELNISALEPGVYIMKIQEGRNSATRKLVVR